MPYLSVDKFKDIVLAKPLDEVVQKYIFKGNPFIVLFNPGIENIISFHLHSKLGLSEKNISIVGSAKIGFSLNPDTFPRRFTDRSDIDIVVVDKELFDKVWFIMLEWNYPRKGKLIEPDWGWSKKRRGELYWGWFVPSLIHFKGLSFPNVLKPLRDISVAWFDAFQSLSQYPVLSDRRASGRLYRSWEHAKLYHIQGLRQIRKILIQERSQ